MLNATVTSPTPDAQEALHSSRMQLLRTRPNRARITQPKKHKYRSDEQWIDELSGQRGTDAQVLAHEDLSAYLYVVAVNYLQRKYAKSTAYTDLEEGDLATFAGDFIQDFMVKMMNAEYALLDKYGKRGRFTSWVAQIIHNLIGSEMRRAYWRNETPTPHEELRDMLYDEESSPEAVALRNTVGETLLLCLNKLPEHYRSVIERCILLGEPAIDVATDEDVTTNSIYIRLHRAKEQLRKIAVAEGLGPDVLAT